MPIDWILYFYIKQAICKMADKKIMAKTAADSYQKRAITRALSVNARRVFSLSINNLMQV